MYHSPKRKSVVALIVNETLRQGSVGQIAYNGRSDEGKKTGRGDDVEVEELPSSVQVK